MVQIIPFSIHWLLAFAGLSLDLRSATAQASNRISLHAADSLFIGTREQLDRGGRREYYAFRGIPYAYPPMGERRFLESEIFDVGSGTHYATDYGSICPQWGSDGNVQGSENCLFLNIYTPYLPTGALPVGVAMPRGVPLQSSKPLLPVIVFVHGGSFLYGSGEDVGPKRLMRHDVVLVTFNYRLGTLGFLSTGDEAIGGNYGISDIVTALKWVQKYIRGFGGNPGRVTVLGHSAGAAAVHMLMLSPRALGHFHGVIMQSGSAFCDWAVNENPMEYATQIGEALGCSTGDSMELLQCLQEKPVEEIVGAQGSLRKMTVFPMKATPVIDVDWRGDDAFLPGDPRELMDTGAFAQVPVIAGVTRDEGLRLYAGMHLQVGAENFRDQSYFENEFLPEVLSHIMDKPEPISVTVDAVKAQYFEEIDVVNETKKVISEFSEMLGDKLFYSCHWDTLERLAVDSKRPVYSYVFSHKTPSSPSYSVQAIRKIRQMGIHHALFNYGVSHEDDLFYLFDPIKGFQERMGAEDERVSDILTRAFVSFATTESPASGLQLIPNSVPWRPIKPGNINYYNITSLPSPMGEDFRKGEALFWLRTVPYIQQLGDTIGNLEDYPTYFWIALGVALFLLLVTLILACVLWRSRTSY